MEYSFVHHRGVLWTNAGPRRPDGELWHADLPMHPSDASQQIVLESAAGKAETTVIELAAYLLGTTSSHDAGEAVSQSRSQRSLPGSVAQLTTGLRSAIASERSQAALHELLSKQVRDVVDPGWVEVSDTGRTTKPWRVHGAALPKNMQRIDQHYASEAAANRSADRMRDDARVAVVSDVLSLPQVRIRTLLDGEMPFTLIEALQISSALDRSPVDVLAL